MVLVRSENGQLLMIPQQALAQMQAQAHVQTQPQTGMAARPATPTSAPPVQISTVQVSARVPGGGGPRGVRRRPARAERGGHVPLSVGRLGSWGCIRAPRNRGLAAWTPSCPVLCCDSTSCASVSPSPAYVSFSCRGGTGGCQEIVLLSSTCGEAFGVSSGVSPRRPGWGHGPPVLTCLVHTPASVARAGMLPVSPCLPGPSCLGLCVSCSDWLAVST